MNYSETRANYAELLIEECKAILSDRPHFRRECDGCHCDAAVWVWPDEIDCQWEYCRECYTKRLAKLAAGHRRLARDLGGIHAVQLVAEAGRLEREADRMEKEATP